MKRKWLAEGIILLMIGMSLLPSSAKMMEKNDTTPPVTTCTLDPPEPDGENRWYVSNVTVILNASDDISGVNITRYRMDNGSWLNYSDPFLLVDEWDDICVEFYSVDNAGNQEDVKSVVIDIDKTNPVIEDFYYEDLGGNPDIGWLLLFTAIATDTLSGMDRVEFYLEDLLHEVVTGSGPEYYSFYHIPSIFTFRVYGFISKRDITDDYVKFFALIVRITGPFSFNPQYINVYAYDTAGNMDNYGIMYADTYDPYRPASVEPGMYFFQNITLPNNYKGHVGRFFVWATFYEKER